MTRARLSSGVDSRTTDRAWKNLIVRDNTLDGVYFRSRALARNVVSPGVAAFRRIAGEIRCRQRIPRTWSVGSAGTSTSMTSNR
jgi:hypothetical protein